MKSEHPAVYAAVGWTGWLAVRAWLGTLRLRVFFEDPTTHPTEGTQRCIYALWHETLLFPTWLFSHCNIRVLISRHRDGEYITRIVQRLGYEVIRGSTTRGAVPALREIMRGDKHLAITPDGPRGPRRVLQQGTAYLAARTGMPIVPVGTALSRAWRARSWDQFVLPKPFARAACYLGPPIHVPATLGDAELGLAAAAIGDAMERAMIGAEQLLCGTVPSVQSRAPEVKTARAA
jgi:hypothetical protein